MSKSDGNWGWLIDNKVLQVTSSDVLATESEHTIGVRLLGKSDSDWGWLIDNQVLEVTSGDVLTSKGEHTI